jgi:hypothetical protein
VRLGVLLEARVHNRVRHLGGGNTYETGEDDKS